MSKFNTVGVKQLAELIKLELTEAESKLFAGEMDETIGYIKNLEELPTDKVDPTYQTTGLQNRFQEEKLNERQLEPKEALGNAPHTKDDYFQIKGLGYAK